MAGRPASTVTVEAGAPRLFGASRDVAVRYVAAAVVALFVGSTAAAVTLVSRAMPTAEDARKSTPVTWSNDDLVAIGADRRPTEEGGALAVVPVRVAASSIGVDAPVDPLGLTPTGAMEVPTDFARVGWYQGSAAPGDPGVSVLAGHLDDADGPAVFFKLERLKPGEQIEVQRSDGTTARFAVTDVKVFPKQRFPTDQVFGTAAGPGLRLVTCIGRFDRKRSTYLDNLVVFATPIDPVAA